MTSTDDLARDLADHVRSKNATTFFLNAPPGAGKSHLLARLASCLPERLAPGYALGPYSVDLARTKDLCGEVMRDWFLRAVNEPDTLQSRVEEANFVDDIPGVTPYPCEVAP